MPSSSKTKNKKGSRTTPKKDQVDQQTEPGQGPQVPIEILLRITRQKLSDSEALAAEWEAVATHLREQLTAAYDDLKKVREELDTLMEGRDGEKNGSANHKQSGKIRDRR